MVQIKVALLYKFASEFIHTHYVAVYKVYTFSFLINEKY